MNSKLGVGSLILWPFNYSQGDLWVCAEMLQQTYWFCMVEAWNKVELVFPLGVGFESGRVLESKISAKLLNCEAHTCMKVWKKKKLMLFCKYYKLSSIKIITASHCFYLMGHSKRNPKKALCLTSFLVECFAFTCSKCHFFLRGLK